MAAAIPGGFLDFPDEAYGFYDFDEDDEDEVQEKDVVGADEQSKCAVMESDHADEISEEDVGVCGNDMPYKVDGRFRPNPNDVPLKKVDTLRVVIAPVNETGEGDSVAADKLKDSSDLKWVDSIRKKQLVEPRRLTTLSSSKSCSIHRVPNCFRRHNKNAYDPQTISIGPFHYKKREKQLQSMEEHKWRYLKNILDHGKHDLLERCLLAIRKLEGKARKCYSEEFDHLDSNHFVEMLVLDGFFIIEFFGRSINPKCPDDPILKLGWLKSAIKMDLILLENQIPFFVLESLCKEKGTLEFDTFLETQVRPSFSLTNENAPNSTPQEEKQNAPAFQSPLHFACCLDHLPGSVDTPNVTQKEEKKEATKFQHLLHFVHGHHLRNSVDTPNSTKEEEKENGPKFHLLRFVNCLHPPTSVHEKPTGRKPQTIPNASRLQGAGIKFEVGHYSDIMFQKGVIKIPLLKVKDAAKSLLLNFVAFEQCYRHCNSHFSGYTHFMDCLIGNANDVQILCEKGIVNRWLSSDQQVAALFNKMGKEIIVYDHDSNLLRVCEDINHYYDSPWHAWRTSLKLNYFNNPWAIISVAAAIVLLLLTFSQTFFAAFPKFAAGN